MSLNKTEELKSSIAPHTTLSLLELEDLSWGLSENVPAQASLEIPTPVVPFRANKSINKHKLFSSNVRAFQIKKLFPAALNLSRPNVFLI